MLKNLSRRSCEKYGVFGVKKFYTSTQKSEFLGVIFLTEFRVFGYLFIVRYRLVVESEDGKKQGMPILDLIRGVKK